MTLGEGTLAVETSLADKRKGRGLAVLTASDSARKMLCGQFSLLVSA